MISGKAHGQKCRAHIVIDDALELVGVGIENRRPSTSAGTHDDGVNPTHKVSGRVSDADHVFGGSGIARLIADLAEAAQARACLLQYILSASGNEKRSTFAQHGFGAGKAYAGAAAIDKRPLVL